MSSPASEKKASKPTSEFYLTTMWKYYPAAAKRIIDEMNFKFPGARIMYDKEFHWFKVNCLLEDQLKLTEFFSYVTADVEDDAFEHDPNNLLDPDGRIKQTFDNELIAYENDSFDSDWVLNALEDYTFPDKLADLPYKDVWTRLEDVSLTIQQLVNNQEFGTLQRENGVTMAYDGTGKLVYIASHSTDNIRQVKEKLKVILEYKQLPEIRTEHLLYSEGYIETGGEARDEFLADVRYLANIHPKLPVATLLDPAFVNLEPGYRRVYQQGASLRLCKYDPIRGRHFSLYGPEIKGRGGMRYPLGNRPPVFVPNNTRHGRHIKHDSSFTELSSAPDDKEKRVTRWIEDVPTQSSEAGLDEESAPGYLTDEYYTATPTAYPESSAERIIDDIRSVVKSLDSREGKKEQLMTLLEELVKQSDKSSYSSPRAGSPSAAVNHDGTLESAILSDRPLPLKMLGRMSDESSRQYGVPPRDSGWSPRASPGTTSASPYSQYAQPVSVIPRARPPVSPGKAKEDVVRNEPIQLRLEGQQATLESERTEKNKDLDCSPQSELPSAAANTIETIDKAILLDRPLRPQILGTKQMPGKSSAEAPNKSRPPSSEKPKPRQIPPPTITWSMAPLVPERVYVSSSSGPSASSSLTRVNDENKKGFKRYNEPGAGAFNTMDQNGKSHRPSGKSKLIVPSAKTSPTQIFKPRDTYITKNPGNFKTEIDGAMERLLSLCPYQRGKVSLCADFGRIILAGMDQSALAFNNPRTPSNGWKKQHLISHLNGQVSGRERIHFTKILSTYGSDIEHMINTSDLSEKRMWQPTPTGGWVVYCFRAIYVHDAMETNVLINCIFGDEGKTYTYEIAPFNSANDGITPLYVHGLLHSWDLRIKMTSFDSQALESGLGSDVRRFLDTVQVLKMGVDGIELKYCLHEKTPLKVQETRVLTKWRYLHSTMKSELEITEVESLSTTPVSQTPKREYLAQTPSKKELKFRQAKGFATRWYEASVVSTTMERLFEENETLGLGKKTSWDLQTLRSYQGEDVFAAIYEPALEMLKQMNQVGGNDSNNMPPGPEYEVRRPNQAEAVPGYTRDARALNLATNTSTSSTKAGWGRLGESKPSTAAGPSTNSTGQHQQPHIREMSNQSNEDTSRRRWDARMEKMEREQKVYW